MRMGILAFALSLVVMASAVMAADPVGVGTPAPQSQYAIANTSNEASNIQGGTVYKVDLEMYSAASSWAGIYGTITEKIVLGSDTHKFFEWTPSSATLPSYIYITYNTDIVWNTVQAPADASAFGGVLNNEIGWSSTDEPVSATFGGSGDCGTGTNTIAALVYGDLDNDTTFGYEWPVCAYVAQSTGGSDRTVYAAVVSNGTAYNGNSANYEAIVAAGSNGETIYFYKQ